MNWLEGIQKAIRYIEDNLTGDLKIADIAAKAYSSETCFQKTFALLCGFTVGEYIRNRRLSCAGNDLLATDEKVIDIALKYGYRSTDGFTKAFTRFHGVTPSDVRRRGGAVKTYAPLKLELLMKGGYVMDYRLQKQKAFKAKVRLDHASATIWFVKDKNLSDLDLISLEWSYRNAYPAYTVCRVEPEDVDHAAEYEIVTVPAVLWAVFGCRGTSRDKARDETIRKIMNEWFPQTGYEPLHEDRRVIHTYSAVDVGNYGEVMIPVKEKRL